MNDVLFLIGFVGLGLLLGSFTTALAYRAPRLIPWAFGHRREDASQGVNISAYRSICPNCQTVLQPRDLVPLFSWIYQRGRCRHCHAPISFLYPLIEACVLLCVLIAAVILGWQLKLAFVIAAVPFLVALLFIDAQHMILPDSLMLPLAMLGAGYQFALQAQAGLQPGPMLMNLLIAPVFYAGSIWLLSAFMTKMLKRDALGFGDVKFFAIAGLWLGLSNFALFCLLSGILGVAQGILWNISGRGRAFPFGPALIVALYVLLLLPVAACGICDWFLLE
ncbi:MAG: prepilin peptidase [Alphaproteobacteria bacterium]|nr:prepilin peptidase [Alphaproteobacteria bacterium]